MMMDEEMKAWLKAEIKVFFDKRSQPVVRGVLHSYLMGRIPCYPREYAKVSRRVLDMLTLDGGILEGYTVIRGRSGGIIRDKDYAAKDAAATQAIYDALTTASKPINDHVCPSCGNDKVSKTERSCWKCGGKLS
jgi:hypothetical protein